MSRSSTGWADDGVALAAGRGVAVSGTSEAPAVWFSTDVTTDSVVAAADVIAFAASGAGMPVVAVTEAAGESQLGPGGREAPAGEIESGA